MFGFRAKQPRLHGVGMFFVVAITDLYGERRELPLVKPTWSLGGESQEDCPGIVVTAITVGNQLNALDGINAPETWSALIQPGAISVRACPYWRPLEFHDPHITFTNPDGTVEPPNEKPQRVASLGESWACGHAGLIISDTAKWPEKPKFFLTSDPTLKYMSWNCEVLLRLSNWAEIPRCLKAYDEWMNRRDSTGFAELKLPPRIHGAFSRDVAAADIVARQHFEHESRAALIAAGSFIPCTIVKKKEQIASLCVLEIKHLSNENKAACILHVLTPEYICLDTFETYLQCDVVVPDRRSKLRSQRFTAILAEIVYAEETERSNPSNGIRIQ